MNDFQDLPRTLKSKGKSLIEKQPKDIKRQVKRKKYE